MVQRKKITPAQGRFTPNLVAWQRYAHFCFASHGIHININIYISKIISLSLNCVDHLFPNQEPDLQWFVISPGFEVVKSCHGAYLTCKAYNGRIVAEWLLNCSIHAEQGSWPDHPRTFGAWIRNEITSGNLAVPSDSRLLHQRLAMKLLIFQ